MPVVTRDRTGVGSGGQFGVVTHERKRVKWGVSWGGIKSVSNGGVIVPVQTL